MAKLSKEFIELFVRVSDKFHVALAPENLQAAIAKADAANDAYVTASDAAEDAKFDEPNAQALWDQEAEKAVRAGKSLPNRDAVDTARIKVKTTGQDASAAKRQFDFAQYELQKLLEDPTVVATWREAIEARTSGLQNELSDVVAKIEPLVTEVSWLLGLSQYLGNIGWHNYPPVVAGAESIAALQTLALTPPWSPAPAPQNITVNDL